MKFRINRLSKAPDENPEIEGTWEEPNRHINEHKSYWFIEINTLEELIELQKKLDNPLVIEAEDFLGSGSPYILVYDDNWE